MVAMLRERVGRRQADILLWDAWHKGNTSRLRLGDALDAHIRWRLADRDVEEGDLVLYAVTVDETRPAWIGAELQLNDRLPETINDAMSGRRLGDVVTGSGADDHVIDCAQTRKQGTRIFIETRLLDSQTIRPGGLAIATGSLRRMWNWSVYTWIDLFTDRRYKMEPTMLTMSMSAFLILVGIAGLAASILALTMSKITGLIAIPVVLPLYSWFITGLIADLWISARQWTKNRRGTSS